jgi:hypothetical protein
MSRRHLGSTIDVHTGGIDLRFPHHEDERAQSNAVAGPEVVRHWVHGEHLLFEGRKMSKSSGNVVLVSDVVARGLDPLALRLAFLQHRYRQQMNLTWQVIEGAQTTIDRWRQAVAAWATEPSAARPADMSASILAFASDDLDFPRVITALREVEKDPTIAAGVKFDLFADGNSVRTGWVSSGDGLLVLDRNADGQVNDGSELFGSSTTLASGERAADGYVALRELDFERHVLDGAGGQVVEAEDFVALRQQPLAALS